MLTLVARGHPIYESDDILIYAHSVARSDAPMLYPGDTDERREVEGWLAFYNLNSDDPMAGMAQRAGACIAPLSLPMFITSIKYISFRRILIGFLFLPDKKRPALFATGKLFGMKLVGKNPAAELLLKARLHMPTHLQTINQTLENNGGSWLIREDYSLADITVGCILLRLDETGWLEHFATRHSLQALLDYYERLKKCKGWQAVLVGKTIQSSKKHAEI